MITNETLQDLEGNFAELEYALSCGDWKRAKSIKAEIRERRYVENLF